MMVALYCLQIWCGPINWYDYPHACVGIHNDVYTMILSRQVCQSSSCLRLVIGPPTHSVGGVLFCSLASVGVCRHRP